MESLTKILGWFKAGSEPSEEQFKQSWTSFWHKSEKMPQTQILGLNNALNEKASKEDLTNVIAGLRPMGDALNIEDLNTKPKRDNDSFYVLDQLDENNNPYIFRYDAKLDEWINTKQIVYKDFVKKKDLEQIEHNMEQLDEPVVISRNHLSDKYYLNGAYIASAAALSSTIKYNSDKNTDGSYKNIIALFPVGFGNTCQIMGWKFTSGRVNTSVLELDELKNIIENTYCTNVSPLVSIGGLYSLNYKVKNTNTKYFAFEIRNAVFNNVVQDNINTIYCVKNRLDYAIIPKDDFSVGKVNNISVSYNSDNMLIISKCVEFNGSKAIFDYDVAGSEYVSLIGYDSSFINAFSTANDFIEYDESGSIIKQMPLKDNNQKTYKYIKLNDATRKIRIQILNSRINPQPAIKLDLDYIVRNLFLHIGNKPYKTYFYSTLSKINNSPLKHNLLRDKIIWGLGDSIMAFGSSSTNGSWLDYINANTEAVVYNYAKGNATLCDYTSNTIDPVASNNTVVKHMLTAISEAPAPDIVFINGGVNDIARSRSTLPGVSGYGELSYGEIDFTNFPNVETNNTHQVYPALQFIIAKLREVNPFVKIYLVTHIRALPHETVTIERLKAFRQAFFNVSKAYSIDIIDMWQCGIMEHPKTNNPYFNTNGVSDQIHPSQFGVNLMGAMALKYIESTYCQTDNTSINFLGLIKG